MSETGWVKLLESLEPKLSKIMEMLGRQNIRYQVRIETYRNPSIWVKDADLPSADYILTPLKSIPDYHPVWSTQESTWWLYLKLEGIASLCSIHAVDSAHLADMPNIRSAARRLNGPLHGSTANIMDKDEEDKFRSNISVLIHRLTDDLLASGHYTL